VFLCSYLDGGSRVPSVLSQALDILQEKELHLRTPLEELELLETAEQAAAAGGGAAPHADAELMEAEAEAEEVEAMVQDDAVRQRVAERGWL